MSHKRWEPCTTTTTLAYHSDRETLQLCTFLTVSAAQGALSLLSLSLSPTVTSGDLFNWPKRELGMDDRDTSRSWSSFYELSFLERFLPAFWFGVPLALSHSNPLGAIP